MQDLDFYLKKAGDFHGHICGGIVFGTLISLVSMKALGLDPDVKNKKLIVIGDDRRITDASRRFPDATWELSFKYIDYGKFAATFVNTDSGRAFLGII